MGFCCTLIDGEFHPDVHRRGERYLIVAPIGFEDDGDRDEFYSLFVILEPRPGGDMELSFCITVEDADGNCVDDIWDSGRARILFDGSSRRLILINLLIAIRSLLTHVKPALVFLCTHEIDAKNQAMRKFLLIAETFEVCGYKVERFDSYGRRYLWRMMRTEEGIG